MGDNLVIGNDRGELVVIPSTDITIRKNEHQSMITCLSVSQDRWIVSGSVCSA